MIQTESTPNPNSLKFLSEKVISAIGTEEFQREKSKDLKNKFVKELLEFKGVELVLLSKNFLSVKKIKKAKSDSEPIPEDLSNLEKKPEALNLINIYAEMTKKSLEAVLNEVAGKEYSFLKTKLSDILISEIVPIGKEIKKLLDDKAHLMQILKKGKEKANIIAEENLKNIREKVGLI